MLDRPQTFDLYLTLATSALITNNYMKQFIECFLDILPWVTSRRKHRSFRLAETVVVMGLESSGDLPICQDEIRFRGRTGFLKTMSLK